MLHWFSTNLNIVDVVGFGALAPKNLIVVQLCYNMLSNSGTEVVWNILTKSFIKSSGIMLEL